MNALELIIYIMWNVFSLGIAYRLCHNTERQTEKKKDSDDVNVTYEKDTRSWVFDLFVCLQLLNISAIIIFKAAGRI